METGEELRCFKEWSAYDLRNLWQMEGSAATLHCSHYFRSGHSPNLHHSHRHVDREASQDCSVIDLQCFTSISETYIMEDWVPRSVCLRFAYQFNPLSGCSCVSWGFCKHLSWILSRTKVDWCIRIQTETPRQVLESTFLTYGMWPQITTRREASTRKYTYLRNC